MNELEALRIRIRAFADERDWNQFHSPKNLSMALIVEAGEIAIEPPILQKVADKFAIDSELTKIKNHRRG